MRIGLAALATSNLSNGHGTYFSTLVRGLLDQDDHPVVLLSPRGAPTISTKGPHEQVWIPRRTRPRRLPIILDSGIEWVGGLAARLSDLDVMIGFSHWPMPRTPGIPTVAVVYEAELMQQHPWGLYSEHSLREDVAQFRRNLRGADSYVAISEHAKRSAVLALGLPRDRVFVGPPALQPFPRCVRCPGLPAEDYVAVVGWFAARKDLPLALASWLTARRAGLTSDLVLIGQEGGLDRVHGSVARRVLDAVGPLARHVHLTGSIDRGHLGHLVSEAKSLLVTSRHEGFGIPAVEALSLGTPVVTVRRASLPEAVGSVGIVCEPDPDSLAHALLQVAQKPADSSALRRHAKSFTPERQLAAVWKAIAAARE